MHSKTPRPPIASLQNELRRLQLICTEQQVQLEEAQRQHEADLTEADHALTALQETIDDKAERVADLEHVLSQIRGVIAQKDSSIDEAGAANAALEHELASQQANLDEALAMLAEVREEGLASGDWQMQSQVRKLAPMRHCKRLPRRTCRPFC